MTTPTIVGINNNTKAKLLINDKSAIDEDAFIDIKVWLLPEPLPPSEHYFKFSFAYIENNICVIRFDNERGKGDNMHIKDKEFPYSFVSASQLRIDFENEIWKYRNENSFD